MAGFNASVDVPPSLYGPRLARRVVRELLVGWGAPHLVEDAELLVTELVTNAVEHVGGEVSLLLQVSLSDGWVRVSLADGSSVRPVLRELRGLEPRGRGVRLIDQVAQRWGSEDYHGGKRVWFEIGRSGADG